MTLFEIQELRLSCTGHDHPAECCPQPEPVPSSPIAPAHKRARSVWRDEPPNSRTLRILLTSHAGTVSRCCWQLWGWGWFWWVGTTESPAKWTRRTEKWTLLSHCPIAHCFSRHFFSVRRLHGFRQVVQHVQEHVAVGINWLIKSRKGRCCSGRKSKLVEDRYIVLCTVTLIKETKQNTKNQTNKNKTKTPNTKRTQTHKTRNKQPKTTHTNERWRDKYQFMGEKDRLKQEVIA